MEHWFRLGYKAARRVIVAVVGGTIVLIGVAMLVLPGPAFVVIPVGLGVLGLEFAWARAWLKKVKETAATAAARVQGRDGAPPTPAGAPASAEADSPEERSEREERAASLRP